MAQTRTDRSHKFGHISTYTAENGDALILDAYSQQYSLSWSTDLKPSRFVSIWSSAGAEKSRMLIHLKGSEEPLEGYGYQLFGMVRKESRRVNEAPIALIRLWLYDVSVTWQLLPESQATTSAVVGIASNRVDPTAILSYFFATATPSIQAADKNISELLSELHLKQGNLSTLRYAARIAENPGINE